MAHWYLRFLLLEVGTVGATGVLVPESGAVSVTSIMSSSSLESSRTFLPLFGRFALILESAIVSIRSSSSVDSTVFSSLLQGLLDSKKVSALALEHSIFNGSLSSPTLIFATDCLFIRFGSSRRGVLSEPASDKLPVGALYGSKSWWLNPMCLRNSSLSNSRLQMIHLNLSIPSCVYKC